MFAVILLSFMIPFDAIAIPLSATLRDWGLQNTYLGLMLPGIGNGLAIFLLRQFFLAVPRELVEAARMDGLGWWGVFWKIYLPLSRPALIGAGLTLFTFQWQSYMWPLLIGTEPSRQLGPIALSTLQGQLVVDYGQVSRRGDPHSHPLLVLHFASSATSPVHRRQRPEVAPGSTTTTPLAPPLHSSHSFHRPRSLT
ncbi:carbohydrate ABC transporter permease [Streptomyces thinghirensis]|nr:carbohydrate ABC transporter permease [Streptomyces thinghirensis]